MKKFEPVGYAVQVKSDASDCGFVSEITVNKEFMEKYAKLSDFKRIIIVDEADIFTKRVLGNSTVGLYMVDLISIVGNIITVERFGNPYIKIPIVDMQPYYPEYDLQIGEKHPEWVQYVLKQYS